MSQLKNEFEPNIVEGNNYKQLINLVFKYIDIIGKTIGPHGKNVLTTQYGNEFSSLVINSKDGFKTFLDLKFQNRPMDIIHKIILDAVIKTNVDIGDGTSTTLVVLRKMYELLNEFYDECNKQNINISENEILILFEDICNVLKESLKEYILDIDEFKNNNNLKREILHNIAMVASNNDIFISQNVSDIFESKSGETFFNIEVNNESNEDVFNKERGIEYNQGFISSAMANLPDGINAEYNNPKILMVDGSLNDYDLDTITTLAKYCITKNTALIIFASTFSKQVVHHLELMRNGMKFKFKDSEDFNIIKVPIMAIQIERKKEINSPKDIFGDLETIFGATPVSSRIGRLEIPNLDEWDYLNINILGGCDHYKGTTKYSYFKGLTKTNTDKLNGRIKIINEYINNYMKDDRASSFEMDIARFKVRLNLLVGNMITLKVGGANFKEKEKRRLVYEDAMSACRNVLTNGITIAGQSAIDYELRRSRNKYCEIVKKVIPYEDLATKFLDAIRISFSQGMCCTFENANLENKNYCPPHVETSIAIYNIIDKKFEYFDKKTYVNNHRDNKLISPGNIDIVIIDSVLAVIKILFNTFSLLTLTPYDAIEFNRFVKNNKQKGFINEDQNTAE